MRNRCICRGIKTCGAVLARTTGTLIHVYVAVATEQAGVGDGALQDRTFSGILADEVVCTHAIRKPLGAPTCVGMIGNRAVTGGIAATSPVLAWTAVALVDVQIAIATPYIHVRTLQYAATLRVLGDEAIVAPSICEPSAART